MSSRASCILLPELQPAVFRIIRPDEKVNGVIKFESEPGFGIIRPKLPYKDPNRTKFALRKTLEIVGLNGQHLIINSHAEKYSVEGQRKKAYRIIFSWCVKGGPITTGDFPIFQGYDGKYYKITRPFQQSTGPQMYFDLYEYDPATGAEKLIGVKTTPETSRY